MTAENQRQLLLLVEDSEDDAFLFKWTFKNSGADFDLRHAVNGAEAIEILRTAQEPASLPRIIFLDLKMPVLNGFDVLAWMQTNGFLSQIPVVVVSGSAQAEDQKRARQLGAMDYLIKPVKVADLHRIFGEVLSRPTNPTPAPAGARP